MDPGTIPAQQEHQYSRRQGSQIQPDGRCAMQRLAQPGFQHAACIARQILREGECVGLYIVQRAVKGIRKDVAAFIDCAIYPPDQRRDERQKKAADSIGDRWDIRLSFLFEPLQNKIEKQNEQGEKDAGFFRQHQKGQADGKTQETKRFAVRLAVETRKHTSCENHAHGHLGDQSIVH